MKPIDPTRVRKVLVIKPDHVGDLMLAVPALDAVRRFFADAHIDLLGLESVHGFSLAHGLVDRIVPFQSPWFTWVLPAPNDWGPLAATVRRLRRERYDVAINLRYDLRDLLLTAATGARRTVSYRYRGKGPGITHGVDVDPAEHESRRWMRLLEGAGIRATERPFAPVVSDAAEEAVDRALSALDPDRPLVGVHAWSRTPAKNWPEDRWVELVCRVQSEFGANAALIGSSADKDANARIARAVDPAAVVDTSGLLPLADLPTLVSRLRLFVGVDSGPAHVAGLVGVPVVALFSRLNDPERWRPIGDRVQVLRSDRPCAGCEKRELNRADHDCMARIAVDSVARLVQDELCFAGTKSERGGAR